MFTAIHLWLKRTSRLLPVLLLPLAAHAQAPANDDPSGAIVLPLTTTCTPASATNVGATTTLPSGYTNPGCSGAVAPRDVWFRFTTDATGPGSTTAAITVAGSAAGQLRVFSSTGGAAGPFTSINCAAGTGNNTPAPRLVAGGLTPNTTYYVFVSGFGSADAQGAFTICATPFVPAVTNDLSVDAVQTLTQLPIPAGVPHVVRAVVANQGLSTPGPVAVTLTVTGANSFTSTQTVSLVAGASTTVSFAGFTPTATGTNTLTVSVPADGVSTNNSRSATQAVNTTTFSYADPGGATLGRSQAITNVDMAFACRYTVNSPVNVTQVRSFIVNTGTPTGPSSSVGKTVYGVVMDAVTGILLARSADHVITAADIDTYVVLPFTTPATVSAGTSLYVGMVQLFPAGQTVQYFPYGQQPDVPGRTGAFYNVGTASGAATDIGVSIQGKLMMEAVTAPANVPAQDAAVDLVQALTQLPIPAGVPHVVRAVVSNRGTQALTNLPVTLTVSGANAFTNTQTLATLAPGALATVSFAGFTPTATGTNTLTVSVPADGVSTNNSRSATQAVNTTTFSYADPGVGALTGLGYGPTDANNAGVVRLQTSTPLRVTQVRAYVRTTAVPPALGATEGKTIFGVLLNAAGAVLARSADYVVTRGDLGTYVTFTLTTPPVLPAGSDFYVGVAQAYQPGQTATYFPLGAQANGLGQSNTFYGASTTQGGAPVDLTTLGVPGKLMIEAVTQVVLTTRDAALAATVGLYPNPAHGTFTVQVPAGPLGAATATLHNALGQVVRQRQLGLPAAGGTAEFDVRGLAAGVYTLQLLSGETLVVKRVVLE